jgi:hypothetical protein
MMHLIRLFIFFLCFASANTSAAQIQDTIYLMNGNVVSEKIIDTLLGAVTVFDPKKPGKKLHYEWDQMYMARFADGFTRYYYSQDSIKYNWFTREEMRFFMKGERDSRRGFNPIGTLIGSGIAGLIGGMSGTFWGPVLPYGYMAFSGIAKVKIKGSTVSDARLVDYDAYILGYERVARQKRKIWSVFSGTVGLALGYGFYAIFHEKYPETIQFNFLRIKI